jgi:Domain of unknown function (DUF4907)
MTTTTKTNLIILTTSVIISAIVFVFTYHENNLHYRTFHTKIGWGYEILSGSTTIIRQNEIPALSVTKGFDQKKQAEATAVLVIKKIKNGQPPSIGIFELSAIMSEKDYSR